MLNQKGTASTLEAPQATKSENVHNAAMRLEDLESSLQGLKNKIGMVNGPEDECEKVSNMALVNVLDDVPRYLHDKVNSLLNKIDEISEALV